MTDIDDEGGELDFEIEAEEEEEDSIDEIETEEEDSIDEIIAIESALSASESERLDTAKKLRDWINRSKPENHLILDRLEHDIREDVRLENWSAFALEDLMRPPRYSEVNSKWSKIGDYVVLMRNTLLFIPVLITWYALSGASGTYNSYLAQAKDSIISGSPTSGSTDTFLQIWSKQSIVGYWTLEHVAFWDAVVILALVCLTIIEWYFRRQAKLAAANADRFNDLEFRNVLVDVGLLLHGFRQITPTALTGSLAEAVNRLSKATTAIKDATIDMRHLSAAADSTLKRFADLSTHELEPATKRLDLIVGSLGVAVDAHKSMGELVRNLQTDLGESLGVITSRLDALGNNLDSRLSNQTEKLEFALRGIISESEAVGKRLSAASAAAEEVARIMRASAK
jgi:hypothetical protein